MNHLKEGLYHVFSAIKRHKRLFVLLIVLQILTLVFFSYLLVKYPLNIMNDVQGIMGPLQNANYNSTSIQEGAAFSNDILSVYKSYRALIKDVTELGIGISILLLVFQAGLWIISHRLLEKALEKSKVHCLSKLKNIGKLWLKYFVVLLVTIIIPAVLGYFFLTAVLKMQREDLLWSIMKVILGAFALIYYFMLAALATINSPKWLHAFWTVSIKRFYWFLLTLLINVLIMGIVSYLIYLTLLNESFFWLTTILSLLLIFMLVTCRLFMIGVVQEILVKNNTI